MKSPKRNIYKPPLRIIEIFDNLNDSKIAYYFYKLLYTIQQSKVSFLLKFSKKINQSEIILIKYYEHGYKYHFLKADLKNAYKYRLEYACYMERYGNITSKLQASNYLNVMNNKSILELINISINTRNYLLARQQNTSILESKIKYFLPKIKNLLFIGPSCDPNLIDSNPYTHICLTKPIPIEQYGIPAEKVILILNNIWAIHKKDIVTKWAKENNKASIFSPISLKISNENRYPIEKIPQFIFRSGPMGLQRALTILFSQYNIDKINIQGFDFSLSKDPYKPWYPSLRNGEGFRNIKQSVLFSNMRHDFLLNYLYTKMIYNERPNVITGSLDPFIYDSLDNILAKFENIVK